MSARDELRDCFLSDSRDRFEAAADAYRAEVLREAADVAETLRQFDPAFGARKSAQISENVGVLRVADELRRLAEAAVSGSTAGDEQAETSPWQQAVDGLNALVDAGIPLHIEPDGHIANPCGDEHIEWNRETNRWQLVMDEEGTR
ncbi:hypothetical protein ABZ508_26450 [Streptomyces lavendulocolor]|uniref:Uncharacterized protein n=1 Tax=Streptomyces lavendulocolor TaxID=67316 RepID=A0ABV2WC55_9ACTN